MAPPSFKDYKEIVQNLSFAFSIVLNSLLIILVLTKSPKRIGNYKYLMIYFSIFAMCFSVLDIILQPYLLSINGGFIVVSGIRNTFIGQNVEIVILSSLCGCFGVCLSTIAIHFIFRFFALERKGKLKYFQSKYLLFWLSIPILVGVVWTAITVYFCQPSDITTTTSKYHLLREFNIKIESMTYIGAVYFTLGPDGKRIPNEFAVTGMTLLFLIMAICISILTYFAMKSYIRVKKLIEEGESSYTKHLQKQLYKSLVVQACIPMFFLYIPIGLYLTLPIIGCEFDGLGKFVTFIYAIYPSLDPLPIIFIIDSYRYAILDFFGCCQNKNRVDCEIESVSRAV